MTDTLIQCFLVATQTLNFSLAAQKLHISQPALSRNIAVLEDELGFPLFWRSKQRGLRSTPAGLSFYNGMKHVQREFEECMDRAKRINRGEQGKLIISVLGSSSRESESFSLIRRFQKQYPQIEITLQSCSYAGLLESIESGKSDVCFASENLWKDNPSILREPLFEVTRYLAVPTRLHCDPDRVYRLSDFKDELFLLSEDAPEMNLHVMNLCRECGFEPKTRMAPDYETKMLWVELGIGVSGNSREYYMTDRWAFDHLRVAELPNLRFGLLWEKSNYNPAIALLYGIYENAAEA